MKSKVLSAVISLRSSLTVKHVRIAFVCRQNKFFRGGKESIQAISNILRCSDIILKGHERLWCSYGLGRVTLWLSNFKSGFRILLVNSLSNQSSGFALRLCFFTYFCDIHIFTSSLRTKAAMATRSCWARTKPTSKQSVWFNRPNSLPTLTLQHLWPIYQPGHLPCRSTRAKPVRRHD